MLENLIEAIAEIIYDNEMGRNMNEGQWILWDKLPSKSEEIFLKIAEEIIEVIQEEIPLD